MLILVLTVFVISIITQRRLKHGPESVWKILLIKMLAGKIRGLCFGNTGSSSLGKWSNFIRRRDLYLFEMLVIKRVFGELQGRKEPFSTEVNGEIPMALNKRSEKKEKDLHVRDNRESNVWM